MDLSLSNVWAVESPMEASPLFAVLELLGLKISWFLICVGETDMATNVGGLQLAIYLVSKAEASLGVAWSLFVPITFSLVQKRHVPSFMFACGRDVWHGLKVSCATYTSMVTSRVMGRATAWISGMMNNGYIFCVEIPFVVSVSEILFVV